MVRIGFVGHFGGDQVFFDGQTVKTKNLYRAVQGYYAPDFVKKLDTYGYKRHIVSFFCKTVGLIFSCKNIVMLPDENGVRVFVPLYVTMNVLLRRKLHYAVVGGWLPVFLKKHSLVAKFAKRLDGIYVETSSMKKDLEAMGFENVYMLPNFKYLTPVAQEELTFCADKPYKLCMFSRIMEQKGVEDAIEAVNEINNEAGETVYSLDIYGPVDDGYKERFEELQKQFPKNIRYLGAVDSEKSVEVLRDYFALLFPTKFYTEGIPGTLIDACAAGVPVITSLWVNHADVFYEGVTGWGYEFGNTEQFKQLLKKAAYAPDEFLKMRRTSLEAFEKYAPERAVLNLVQRIS